MCSFTVYRGVFLVCVFFIFVFFFLLILFLYKCPPCPDSPLEYFAYILHLFLCHLWQRVTNQQFLHFNYKSSPLPTCSLYALHRTYHNCFHRPIRKQNSVVKNMEDLCGVKKKTLMKILKLRMIFCRLVLGPSTLRILLTRLEHHFLSPLFQNPQENILSSSTLIK